MTQHRSNRIEKRTMVHLLLWGLMSGTSSAFSATVAVVSRNNNKMAAPTSGASAPSAEACATAGAIATATQLPPPQVTLDAATADSVTRTTTATMQLVAFAERCARHGEEDASPAELTALASALEHRADVLASRAREMQTLGAKLYASSPSPVVDAVRSLANDVAELLAAELEEARQEGINWDDDGLDADAMCTLNLARYCASEAKGELECGVGEVLALLEAMERRGDDLANRARRTKTLGAKLRAVAGSSTAVHRKRVNVLKSVGNDLNALLPIEQQDAVAVY